MQQHFKRLEAMYQAAPLNDFYLPTMSISQGRAEISIDVNQKYFHAAQAVHGSVYFKMLDDAAYFAANSLEQEYFVLTTSFTTYLTRPISSGKMTAIGQVVIRIELSLLLSPSFTIQKIKRLAEEMEYSFVLKIN